MSNQIFTKKKVFYCQTCHKAYAREGGQEQLCPNCGQPMYDTNVDVSLWKLTPEDKQTQMKQQWDKIDIEQEKESAEEIKEKNQEYNLSIAEYEYDVETVPNTPEGLADWKAIKTMLNLKAKQGWRLHTIYSNELGVNSSIVRNLSWHQEQMLRYVKRF